MIDSSLLLLLLIALHLLPEIAHASEGILIVGGLKESGECCEGSVELWSPNFQCKFPGSNAPSSRGGVVDGTVDLVGDRVVACGGKYVDSNGEPLTATTQNVCNQLWLKSGTDRGRWESAAFKTTHRRSKHSSVVTCSSFQGCNSSLPSKDLLLLGGEYFPDTSEVIQLDEGEARELLLITNCNAEKELKSCASKLTRMEEGESKENFPFVQGTGGPRMGHCSVQVDERQVILTGGTFQGFSLTSVTELNVWRGEAVTMSLPDLNSPREGHACGFYLKDGIKTLIVTGGVFKNRGQERILESTEVLSGTEGGFPQRSGAAWRVVSLLSTQPRGISLRGATLDNTFYLIGGLDSNKKARRDILSWDPNSEGWVERGQLMFGRGRHAVTTVPLELAKKHCQADTSVVGFAGFVSTSSSDSSCFLIPTFNLLFVIFEVIF